MTTSLLPLGRPDRAYKLLRDSGFHIQCRNVAGSPVIEVDGDLATVTAILDSYNALPDAKSDKRDAIKAQGLALIQAVLPAISDFDQLALVREQYLSMAPASRQPTAKMSSIIAIYTAGDNAITAVQNANTVAAVNAVTPAWP